MGKHKKPSQNRSENENSQNSASSTTESKNLLNQNDDYKKKIDLLTSQMIDLCGQKSTPIFNANSLWKEHLEIRQRVGEIRIVQKEISKSIFEKESPTTTTTTRGERLRIMSDWCDKNGLRANGVSISAIDDRGANFGLTVEKDLAPGDLVVRVPRKLFLSLENALQRNENLRKTFETDPLLKGMPNVALSLLIAVEKLKGVDSYWSSYLNSLPSIYVTPLCFLIDDDETLAEKLRGSVAFEETLKLYKNIVRQYAYFYQMISSTSANFSSLIASQLLPMKKFVFDLYLWAAVTVMTRINFVPSSSMTTTGNGGKNEMIPALIPFFDMANHGDVPPCTDFVDDDDDGGRQCAVIYASKPYQAGDQLSIYYGERKYWEFFVYNGFVNDDGRRYPNVVVKLGLSNSDRSSASKTEALRRYGMQPSEQFLLCKYDRDESSRMQRFGVVFCANEEELESFLQTDETLVDQFEWPIKTVDEARRFLRTRLSLLLRTYTHQQQNVSEPSSNDVDEIVRGELVSKFIIGEIDSLKSCLTFFDD